MSGKPPNSSFPGYLLARNLGKYILSYVTNDKSGFDAFTEENASCECSLPAIERE